MLTMSNDKKKLTKEFIFKYILKAYIYVNFNLCERDIKYFQNNIIFLYRIHVNKTFNLNFEIKLSNN